MGGGRTLPPKIVNMIDRSSVRKPNSDKSSQAQERADIVSRCLARVSMVQNGGWSLIPGAYLWGQGGQKFSSGHGAAGPSTWKRLSRDNSKPDSQSLVPMRLQGGEGFEMVTQPKGS